MVTDKRMEAIREGVQDYEYLVMLRERVENSEAVGQKSPSLSKARSLLDSVCEQVLAGSEETLDFRWDTPADRSVADRMRMDILRTCATIDGK